MKRLIVGLINWIEDIVCFIKVSWIKFSSTESDYISFEDYKKLNRKDL